MSGSIDLTVSEPTQIDVIQIQVPGARGPKGDTGAPGAPGPASILTIGTVTTGAPGSNAVVTISGVAPNQVLNITVPQGPAGATGAAGAPNTLSIGTITTVAATTGASATITGTTPNQVLNLTVPRGYGVIPAGNQYDVLIKNSATDYDNAWETPSGTGSLTRKSYVDTGDSNTLTSANSHSDTNLTTAKSYADTGDANTLASAKSYTDGKTPAQATTSTPGTMQIAGDLGGTATAPTVTGGTHHTHTSSQISDAASAATVSKVIIRDAAGRAQVVDPAVAADIATKNYVDTHVPTINDATTTTKGIVELAGDLGGTAAAPTVLVGTHHTHTSSQISDAASAATASKVIIRDANGRAQVVDPSVAADIATKNYVDGKVVPNTLSIGTTTTGAAGSQASATITGTPPNQTLSLTIPTGATGATGPQGTAGVTGNGVLFLNSGDAVPAGTPANTVIYRPNTVKTANFFWGSGTAFPTSTAKGAGDTFLRTDVGTAGTIFQYTGNASAGISGWVTEGPVVCTSTTRPTAALYAGVQIFETDTGFTWAYNTAQTAWLPLTAGACMGKLWRTSGSSGNLTATTEYTAIPLEAQRLSGGFTAASYWLIVPIDGLYNIDATLYYTNAGSGFVNGWVVRNRAGALLNISVLGAYNKASGSYDINPPFFNHMVPLKAGDKLSLSAYSYATSVAYYGTNETQGCSLGATWMAPLNGATPL